jgi:dienelactone hydrolase
VINRRFFVQTAAVAAAGSLTVAPALADLPQMQRWDEQKWLLDDIIQSVGMDWDQGRSSVMIASLGPESQTDLNTIRARIKKFADFVPAFEAAARRREGLAKEAEAAGDLITARDNYFMAGNYYGQSQWSIYEKNDENMMLNAKKRETYGKYISLADHHVEYVTLSTPSGKKLPGLFHLPPNYKPGTKIPAIVAIPGMDGYKERSIALYGDRWMNRGVAVFIVEMPGEWEAPLLDTFVNLQSMIEGAHVVADWMQARPEIDPNKIGLTGSSFGTFITTIMAGHEPRFKAVANQSTCYEPGMKSLLSEASPTFKRRFMFMSGYTDEAKFDAFSKTLTLEGSYDRIRVPFMTMMGQDDELSPPVNAERMYGKMTAPRRLVVYADSRHALGGVPSVTAGPVPGILAADWMVKTLNGTPLVSERWFVDPAGRITKTPYA